MSSTTITDIESMKGILNNLISSSDRGANDNNRQEINDLIQSFADEVDIQKLSFFSSPDLLGDWELLYTDDDITR